VRGVHGADRRSPCERLSRARGRVRRCRGRHGRGSRPGRLAAPAAGRVRRARRLPVRVLHAGADLLGYRNARRARGRLAEPRLSRHRSGADTRPGRDPRADEREHLPLRRLPEHRRGDRRGGALKPFRYERAPDESGAVAALAATPGAKFLAGGTNLVDLMRLGVETPDVLIDVRRLPYDRIEETGEGGLRIGAGVRNSDLAADRRVRTRYPALAEALLSGASGQLRNLATTGGNLLQRTRCAYFQDATKPCNKRAPGSGCPAREGEHRNLAIIGHSEHCVATHPSDMAVALAAFDAVVHVVGPAGAREVRLLDLHKLPGDTPQHDTVLERDDLVVAVELPALPVAARSRYRKVRERASFSFALVSVAVALEVADGEVRDVRIAFGGVAHKPWRAHAAEEALRGSAATVEAFGRAADAELAQAEPLRDNGYKLELARNTLVRTLAELAE